MPARRKPLLSPDAAAFVRGDDPGRSAAPAAAPPALEEETVRFTVDLPAGLHRRLKLAAMDRRQPMTATAREALVQWLDSLPS
jgi:hypothetical protein